MQKKIILIALLFFSSAYSFFSPLRPTAPQPFFIMIDPAGDAKHIGRKIDDSFERGITLQCAEALKTTLEERYSIRVVLTRFPGEALEPLQNANFANRLKVDLYLNLHCYQESNSRPQLFIYRCSQGNEFVTKTSELAWHPYDQAHQINSKTTRIWAHTIHKNLDNYKNLFDCRGIFAVPFKPLLGITAPALALEIGIKKSADWRMIVEPLVASLHPIIQSAHVAASGHALKNSQMLEEQTTQGNS